MSTPVELRSGADRDIRLWGSIVADDQMVMVGNVPTTHRLSELLSEFFAPRPR